MANIVKITVHQEGELFGFTHHLAHGASYRLLCPYHNARVRLAGVTMTYQIWSGDPERDDGWYCESCLDEAMQPPRRPYAVVYREHNGYTHEEGG